jgi:oxygen-independent coproporphyrinogen-3 oxidase
MGFQLPPLSLYVHVPWCLRKCPYCDFNSHELRQSLDEKVYISSLLADLQQDLEFVQQRPIKSIFIGGGTPSLLSPAAIQKILEGISRSCALSLDVEVTLEANPGALDTERLSGYLESGVNRLSVGIQSFQPEFLLALGRIHNPEDAVGTVELAKRSGFDRINIDLMFGLPGQSISAAEEDIAHALGLGPGHISYYQLTIEPNTAFYQLPPKLPDDDSVSEMQQRGVERMAAQGYSRYEISAYAQPGKECQHNLNYWGFGDYLGIGAGAHGKVTVPEMVIKRLWKWRSPKDYIGNALNKNARQGSKIVTQEEIALEFMMNSLRVLNGFSLEQFQQRTGLEYGFIRTGIERGVDQGLLESTQGIIRTTPKGSLFLNELLTYFISES